MSARTPSAPPPIGLPQATVAALVENMDAKSLVVKAAKRFRGVNWDVLKTRPDIIVQGDTIDRAGRGADDLHTLAKKCELAGVDTFVSHSWQDDGEVKWAMLSEWCEDSPTRALTSESVSLPAERVARSLVCYSMEEIIFE